MAKIEVADDRPPDVVAKEVLKALDRQLANAIASKNVKLAEKYRSRIEFVESILFQRLFDEVRDGNSLRRD